MTQSSGYVNESRSNMNAIGYRAELSDDTTESVSESTDATIFRKRYEKRFFNATRLSEDATLDYKDP